MERDRAVLRECFVLCDRIVPIEMIPIRTRMTRTRKNTETNASWSSEPECLPVGVGAPPRWPGFPTVTGAVIGPGVVVAAGVLGVLGLCDLARASGSGGTGVGAPRTAPDEVAPVATS